MFADGRMLDRPPARGIASAEALPLDVGTAHPGAPFVLQPAGYQRRIDLAACVRAILHDLNLLDEPPQARVQASAA